MAKKAPCLALPPPTMAKKAPTPALQAPGLSRPDSIPVIASASLGAASCNGDETSVSNGAASGNGDEKSAMRRPSSTAADPSSAITAIVDGAATCAPDVVSDVFLGNGNGLFNRVRQALVSLGGIWRAIQSNRELPGIRIESNGIADAIRLSFRHSARRSNKVTILDLVLLDICRMRPAICAVQIGFCIPNALLVHSILPISTGGLMY